MSRSYRHSIQSPTCALGILISAMAIPALTAADADPARDRIVTEAAMRVSDPGSAMKRPEVAAAVRRHVHQMGNEPRQLAIIERLGVTEVAPLLIDRGVQWGETSQGVKAIELALRDSGSEAIRKLVHVSDDSPSREQATNLARVLALSDQSEIQTILKDLVADSTVASSVRLPAAAGLARNPSGQAILVSLAAAGDLPADAMTVVAGELRGSRDAKIAAEASRLFPDLSLDDVQLPPIGELVALRGNADKGREMFNGVATCGQCHTVRGSGKNVGPDLSEIGDKLARDAMYVSILNPSAGISHNYEMYVALTEDGEVINGLLVSKNESELILKDKDGIERKYAVDQLEDFKVAGKSLMPENLHRITKVDGLVDVVEYMTTLRKTK